MSTGSSTQPERIRLVFELERTDNPRLYDDLIQCKKGSKRVSRLRTLAQEGLLAQLWSPSWGGFRDTVTGDTLPTDLRKASITNQVFDDPLTE